MNNETLDLAQALINKASVTPEDKGCQDLMCEYLSPLNFVITQLPFEDVKNFWALRGSSNNNDEPCFVFAGHTDVVPTGPLSAWNTDPFKAQIKDNYLYGRGAADMKGSLAAMIIACKKFVAKYPNHKGSIGFLITSDEEGPALNGTQKVIEYLQEREQKIDYCLVGEPSSTKKLGDVIKNGRRGSFHGLLKIFGKQGHIAYPHLADNAIHKSFEALAKLIAIEWDKGNAYFPPTSLQISNLNAGTGASNVIPGELTAQFNLRYSPETLTTTIKHKITTLLDEMGLDYDIEWNLSGEPFITPEGKFTQAVSDAVYDIMNHRPELSTSGGTSDGRFIAPTGAKVIELGPCNATIHQVNECVRCEDLLDLEKVYFKILENLLV